MIACPGCGFEAPDDFSFCPKCATKLVAATTAVEERKVVTTLFCDLVAFTAMSEAADPEDVDALLGEYFARATKAIESHGGTVEKFIGDAVVGVFGVPAVHEDDPERGVRAALRILEALEGMTRPDGTPLEARCGVNTGEALVRLDVDPACGRGFLTGDAVNTAARLEAAAPPGGSAVGALTHELTERRIEYEPLPPVTAKGKSEPVQAWRALAPVSRRGIDTDAVDLTPFIGREVELACLTAMYEKAATQSRPQLALLVGEPGIGKSRLVRQLFQYVDAGPEMTTWRQGYCPPYGEDVTFSALSDMVKGHAGILDTDDQDAVEDKLDAVLPEGLDREWFRQRLRALIGLSAADASPEENFTAWMHFFEDMAASRPTVLVFEDLHWADKALLAFLRHLSTHLESVPLLVVATARPDLFERFPDFAAADPFSRITVEPLSVAETACLVEAVTSHEPVAARQVAARCEGNPFYAEQCAGLLADTSSETALPSSVQAIVSARLDGLSAQMKTTLCAASVVGRVFWSGAVAAAAQLEDQELERLLSGLLERHLIRRSRDSSMAGEREYAFVHALARDVAYGTLPRRAKARQHAEVAAWLECRVSGEIASESELVAHHYTASVELAQASGDAQTVQLCRGPAVSALLRAGEQSMSRDVEAAERALARAAGFCPDDDDRRAPVLRAWGQALQQRGCYDEARRAFEAASELFLARGLKGEAATALIGLERTLIHMVGQEWNSVLERALTLSAEEPQSEARAAALTAMAGARVAEARYAEGLEWLERAADVYRQRGIRVPTEVRLWKAEAECGLGRREAADEILDAVRVLRDEGKGYEAATAYLNAGLLRFPLVGPCAYDIVDEGLEYVRTIGMSEEIAPLENNRAWGLYLAGRWCDALAAVETAEARLKEADDPYGAMFCWDTMAQILVSLQRGPEALGYAEQACQGARESGEPTMLRAALATLVGALALSGQERRAAEMLREFTSLSRSVGYQGYDEAIPELVRHALAFGEPVIAEQLVDEMQPGVPLMDHVLVTGRALLAESCVALDEAAAGYADAAARWHRFGIPYEEAQALLGQGRCLVALGRRPEAAGPLAAAREIFARLGAKPALTETDEWIARVAE
jgi:class 3 adenylate cyclase/tetratricopeptide (TPR) repeat protein